MTARVSASTIERRLNLAGPLSASDAAIYDSVWFRLPVSACWRQLTDHWPVAVHCEAGIGRTGTLLAAYLISKGDSAESAISRVRAVKRSAVETPRQIQFLEQFAAVRLHEKTTVNGA